MRALYYNCNSGISGDMNVAAMLDLGLPLDYLKEELAKLNIREYELDVSAKMKNGISGTQLKVICEGNLSEDEHSHSHSGHSHDAHSHSHHKSEHCHNEHSQEHKHECSCEGHTHSHSHSHADCHCHNHHSYSHDAHSHEHRNYGDIKDIILSSAISQKAKDIALSIFERIAIAEAKVHSKSIDEVAFHEIGAVDSIVDIVASAIALDYFNIDKIYSTSIELGGGQVRCAHGILSVPAPATTLLMQGIPTSLNGDSFECTTPTGAGIISATVDEFNAKFSGKMLATGIGIGHKDSQKLTNILRLYLLDILDEASSPLPTEDIVELSTNIDDMTPEDLSFLLENLLNAGALDAWQEAIYMKKGRLAQKVSLVCKPSDEQSLLDIFMKNSTTYGIRRELKSRYVLPRKHLEKDTPFGKIALKQSTHLAYARSKVEFEDKKRIALEQGLPIMDLSKDLEEF